MEVYVVLGFVEYGYGDFELEDVKVFKNEDDAKNYFKENKDNFEIMEIKKREII